MEIIAEIGQNHNGDLGLAKEMIQETARLGAEVAKFQVYDAKALFPKENNPWYEYNLRTELSRQDLEELSLCCQDAKIEFMASVFDVERIQWLEDLGAKRYKIASRSIRETELIQRLAKTTKPIIASLGMWEEDEFPKIESEAPVDFLYCVSKYPTELSDLNFQCVDFGRYSGFSDHTIGIDAPCIAMARGARILEKHFTLDHQAHGPDHAGSMSPTELEQIVRFRNNLVCALGEQTK